MNAAPAPAPEPAPRASRPGPGSRPRSPGRSRRTALTALVAGVIVLALVAARVLLGTPMVPLDQALRVIGGEAIPGISFIVMENRLPTAVVALLAGIAFGLSGTIFQTLLRNPLASPDVIGVTLGASAGAVIAMSFFETDGRALFWFTLLGGVLTALLILAVAGAGRPGATGAVDYRFGLVGSGVAAAV
ncbi:MAG: iron chelate uptake ABC transporter family permease subunit, partial [Brachybacterium sp.]